MVCGPVVLSFPVRANFGGKEVVLAVASGAVGSLNAVDLGPMSPNEESLRHTNGAVLFAIDTKARHPEALIHQLKRLAKSAVLADVGATTV